MDSLAARLEQHGLGKHAKLFAEHAIDLDVLPDLTDGDLEKLGISLGDRRRILKAVKSLAGDGATEVGPGREAERRQLTVMFTDLVDSTKLAARLDPEDMKDLIGRYQKAVGDEITRFGGYVAKPLGDGLLIYFGWPQAHEDDAERALRAALAAIAAVRKLATPAGVPIATRIGIATGEVVVGDFAGAGVAEEGAVVGETPNLAARLQSVAGENAVVVAPATLKLVGRQFSFTDLGEQNLKGFDRPVRAWQVDGERVSESRFTALHGGRLGRFVGREHEIGFLLERFEEVRDGACQVVLISGEAGIGKSRLVSEVIGRLAADVASRTSYQGSPLHSNTALYPVIRQLELKAGFVPDDPASSRIRKLTAILPVGTSRERVAFGYLSDLMSLGAEGSAAEPKPTPDIQREAALEILVETIAAEASSVPLLVVVEDAHWLDATTQEFVERLLNRLQRRPAMILITYRPEFNPPWAQHANVGLLSLSRLGRRNCQAIVSALFADEKGLSPEIADDIVAKADGNPLYVEELAGSALEAARASDDRAVQIPATLRDALSERLDRLGSARELAQIAAAFGREFSLDLVAAVLGRTMTELESDVGRLTAVDIVFLTSRAEGRYVFKHALLQDAAYESMLKSKRREVHGRIAEVFLKYRPEMAETEPEVLGTHLALAGDTVGAAECWQKAGRLSLRNSAYREAIGAFKNALSLMAAEDTKARADTHRAIASAYFTVGDHKSVREHLEHAATDAEAAGDQVMMAEIAMQRGHDLIHYGGSIADAVLFGERALEIATRLDDDALAYGARFSLGQSAEMGGNFATGIRVLTANLPENLRDPERVRDFGTAGSLMMDSMAILGSIYACCGEFERGLALLDRAAKLATTGAFNALVVQYHLNRAHLHRGDAAIARPLLIISFRLATEAGLKFGLPWLRALLGYARALTGEVEEGIALLQQALDESDAMHLPYVKALATVFLAEALVAGEPERALNLAEAGLGLTRAGGYRAQEAELLRVSAAALATTDLTAAATRAGEALDLARKLGMRPEEAHALRVLGDIAVKRDDPDAARESHDRARTLYADMKMSYWLAQTPRAPAA